MYPNFSIVSDPPPSFQSVTFYYSSKNLILQDLQFYENLNLDKIPKFIISVNILAMDLHFKDDDKEDNENFQDFITFEAFVKRQYLSRFK